MSRVSIHISIVFGGAFPFKEGFDSLLSPIHGEFFQPRLAWLRGWNYPHDPQIQESFIGASLPFNETDPLRWENEVEIMPQYEVTVPGLPFTHCVLPDCRDRILFALQSTTLPYWHYEIRGETITHLKHTDTARKERFFRKLWLDPGSGPCPLLELGLSKTSEEGGWFTVSALSFATSWFHPFNGSCYESFIDSECADENLKAWGGWMSSFAQRYYRFIVEAEVSFGARAVIRRQEERIRRAFAQIPNVEFTTP